MLPTSLWAVWFISVATCFEEMHMLVLAYLVYSCGVPESHGLTGKPPFKCMVLLSAPTLEMHFATLRPILARKIEHIFGNVQQWAQSPQI